MLRRHLQQGGAPIAPCAGFDADTASAYVERVLAAPVQLRFEKHLAGCAACRRHVVALARLSDQLSPLPAASPAAPVQVAEPLWSRWQHAVAQWPRAVAQWFDFSAWKLDWTAATGVACAVLFAVLGAGVWWRAQVPQSEQAAMSRIALDQAPAAAAPTPARAAAFTNGAVNDEAGLKLEELTRARLNQIEKTVSATPEAGSLNTELAASARPAIPQPATTPSFPTPQSLVALTSASELRQLAVEPSAPTVAAPQAPPPSFNLPATAISFNHLNGNHLNGNQTAGGLTPMRLGNDAPLRSPAQLVLLGEPEKKELVNELHLPGPRRNRSAEDAAAKAASAAKTEAGKATSNRELLKALKGRSFGFMPPKGSDKDAKGAKDIDARTKEADLKEAQDQFKPLMKRLNGHVFHLDHGFWIDDEYKSETTQPIKRLVRGSQEYQQILIQNPSLEQFFQLGQVIVVWKGVVYEVRK